MAFSEFGFPKSHAAAFAILAYQSAWLHRAYPAEFLCALLNAQPMGFYPPATLLRDGERRGVRDAAAGRQPKRRRLHGRGVRRGGADRPRLRQGRRHPGRGARRRARPLRALSPTSATWCAARRWTPTSWRRWCGPAPATVRRPPPAALGARPAPRAAGPAEARQLALPLDAAPTPPLPRHGRVGADGGRPPGDGPDHRPAPDGAPAASLDPVIRTAASLREGSGGRVTVAGMMVARQRPGTAKGIVFLLLEDESGMANVIVPAGRLRARPDRRPLGAAGAGVGAAGAPRGDART